MIKYLPDPNSFNIADLHPKWGGNALGRYVRIDSSVNLQPVYQHEFFELYFYWNIQTGRYSIGENPLVDSIFVQVDPTNGVSQVWNSYDKIWEVVTYLAIEEYDYLPSVNTSEESPCKLMLQSDGPLGQLYPETMGVYHLINNR